LPGDAHMPPLHHHAWKFAKHFDQFIKHTGPNKGCRRGGSLQQEKTRKT
jgi:hypothetical protein